MKIHKETIASELQLLMDNVNSKEQTVEEIVAYIRWRDKQLTIPVVVGQSELLCDHPRSERSYIGQNMLRCNKCGKEFS